jgi:hypothetical protein
VAGLTKVNLSPTHAPTHLVEQFIVYGPTDVPWSDTYPVPKAMTEGDMLKVEDAFVAAIERCKVIGCKYTSL